MAGYTTKFHMPIIAPPAAGTDREAYYNGIAANAAIQTVAVENAGIKISFNSSYAEHNFYAMTGGLVRFIPAGQPLPTLDSKPSPGSGSLCLQTHPGDIAVMKKNPPDGLPPGVPPMTSVLYLNVKPDSVRTKLEPHVKMLTESVLKAAYDLPATPTDRAAMENRFLNRLMNGEVNLFVEGGTELGEIELQNPTDTASPIELTLNMTDGAHDYLSPSMHLRTMPEYGGEQWLAHPLIAPLEAVPVPVNIYLKFEIYNETTRLYEPLPQGLDVDLMDHDPISSDDALVPAIKTDAQGKVHFEIPDLQNIEPKPDIYFRVKTNGIAHAGHTLPAEWSTKGWLSVDEKPGYYEDFVGTQIGDALSPLVFRIGLDFHIRIEYKNQAGSVEIAPQGLKVGIHTDELGIPAKKVLPIDDKGEVHGVIFDVQSEKPFFIHIDFELEDSTINLPRATVHMTQAGWSSLWDDADQKWYPDNNKTTIKDEKTGGADPFTCSVNERNVALYFLKMLRELSVFLFHLTGGAWAGVTGLTLFRTSASGTSYSWPVREVNIATANHWDRGTIIHEISHQVMWQEVNYSSLGIGYEAIFGDLALYHWTNLLSNSEHALIEGWAEFVEAIFDSGVTPPYSMMTIYDINKNVVAGGLGPPPSSRGESIEGTFANGLWDLFQTYVVTSAVSASARVPASTNGDVSKTAPWLKDAGVIQRFLDMIWNPLKALKPLSNPDSTAMLAQIKSNNATVWHKLLALLQTYNMAMTPPVINSVSPSSGPVAGGQTISIAGEHFADGIRVKIGGAFALNVIVNNSTSISAQTPPGAAGSTDVTVETKAGLATMGGGYTYG